MTESTVQLKMTTIRYLIEFIRSGFRAVGIDISRIRPEKNGKLDCGEIFTNLVNQRDLSLRSNKSNEEITFLVFCAERLSKSRAQLLQDLFVLYSLHGKRGGFFVEFGATDGVSINNTVLLERDYEWTGIVAEPARYWHQRLQRNRKCLISTDCIWRKTGERLVFNETSDREFSTIDHMSFTDNHREIRHDGERYEVKTISLMDLLVQNNAPHRIDYLSVDTEGSEFEILSVFDFDEYDINIITVEHNFTPNRDRLHELLTRNGYVRRFENFSKWDDWYVRQ